MSRLFGFLIGMRKFTAMILFMIIMTIFRVYDLVDGAQFAENLQIALVAFFGTNIGEHLISLGKDYLQGKLKDFKKVVNSEDA
jgi:hypothetical protein